MDALAVRCITPLENERLTRPRNRPDSWPTVPLPPGPRASDNTSFVRDGITWHRRVNPDGGHPYLTCRLVEESSISFTVDSPLHELNGNRARSLKDVMDVLLQEVTPHAQRDCVEVYIQLPSQTDDNYSHYCVNHCAQTVFWLRPVTTTQLRLHHYDPDWEINQVLRFFYWTHVKAFSAHADIKIKCSEIRSMLSIAAAGHALHHESTFPGDLSTVETLGSAWNAIPEAPTGRLVDASEREPELQTTARNFIAASILVYFLQTRIANHYGTDYARLEKTTVLTSDSDWRNHKTHPWLCFMSSIFCRILFFDKPREIMQHVYKVCPNGTVSDKTWARFIDEVLRETAKTVKLSTIAFAGAMAFMTIPVQNSSATASAALVASVLFRQNGGGPLEDNGPSSVAPSADWIVQAMPIVCPILSCMFSLASIVAGMTLRKHFCGPIRDDTKLAAAYIQHLRRGWLGLDFTLGVFLTLPKILFRWAVASFSVGLLFLGYLLHNGHESFFYAELAITSLTIVLILVISFSGSTHLTLGVHHHSPPQGQPPIAGQVHFHIARSLWHYIQGLFRGMPKRGSTGEFEEGIGAVNGDAHGMEARDGEIIPSSPVPENLPIHGDSEPQLQDETHR